MSAGYAHETRPEAEAAGSEAGSQGTQTGTPSTALAMLRLQRAAGNANVATMLQRRASAGVPGGQGVAQRLLAPVAPLQREDDPAAAPASGGGAGGGDTGGGDAGGAPSGTAGPDGTIVVDGALPDVPEAPEVPVVDEAEPAAAGAPVQQLALAGVQREAMESVGAMLQREDPPGGATATAPADGAATAPADGAAAAPAAADPAKAVLDKFINDQSEDVDSPGGGKLRLLHIAAKLYRDAAEGLDKVRQFFVHLASAGADAAINFAKTAISVAAAAFGPIGWIIGGALKVVDAIGGFTKKGHDWIVKQVTDHVDPVITRAKTMILNAIYAGQQAVVSEMEPTATQVLSEGMKFWERIKAGLRNNAVTGFLINAASQVIAIWKWVLSLVPAPLNKALPQAPDFDPKKFFEAS